MKSRKASDLRELTAEELERMLIDATESYSKNKFQHSLSQLEDTGSLKVLKKDIARIKTVINERQRAK